MKKIAIITTALLALAGCKSITGVDETTREYHVDGSTMTWGDHTYTISGSIGEPEFDSNGALIQTPTAKVTFTHNPEGYNEFSTVYSEFLGKTPHGAAAMIPMAIELYGRNTATGERCIKLLWGEVNALDVIRILDTKMRASEYSPANDEYLQRYLPAALLKGAKPENAYTPEEPYTVQMLPNNTPASGVYSYLYILSEGWDTNIRGVELKNVGNLYIVSNAPACYTQCKIIRGTWNGIK